MRGLAYATNQFDKDRNLVYWHRCKIVSMVRKYHNHKNRKKPMAPRGRATQRSRDTRKSNLAKQPALSIPNQDKRNTRMDIT